MAYVDFLIAGVLFLINIGIGSSLKFKDFAPIFKQPKALGFGVALQILLLPTIAFILAQAFGLPPAAQVGLVILAACPGGTTSNFISYIIKANVPLSIAMTTVNSVITLLTIPFFTGLALTRFMSSDSTVTLAAGETVGQIALVVVVPVVIGILLHRFFRKFADGIQKPLKIINSILLATVFLIKYFASEQAGGAGLNAGIILSVLPAVILLHVLGLGFGYSAGKQMKTGRQTSVTLGIEVGLQNTTLALLVASSLPSQVSHPALVYAIFSFWTSLLFGYLLMKETSWYSSNYTAFERLDWLRKRIIGYDRKKLLKPIHKITSKKKVSKRILFTGDCMPVGNRKLIFEKNILNIIAKADYVVVNLEGIIHKRGRFLALNHTARIIDDLLTNIGKDKLIINVANNHAADFGTSAFEKSYNLIKKKCTYVVGKEDLTIGKFNFVACTYWQNQSLNPVFKLKRNYKKNVALLTSHLKTGKYNILLPHWGYEMHLQPTKKSQLFAKDLLQEWDCVVGNHPHCPQPITYIRKKPVAYSLGNLCSKYKTTIHAHGGLFSIGLDEDYTLVETRYSPTTYTVTDEEVIVKEN
jgi:BASS family bile acid:Na+ symporter